FLHHGPLELAVLQIPERTDSVMPGRIRRLSTFEGDPARGQKALHAVVAWFAVDVAEIVLIAERPEGSAGPLRTGVEKVVKNSFPAACVGPGSVCNDAVHIEDDCIEPLDRDSTLRCRFILGLSDPVFHPSVSPFVRLLSRNGVLASRQSCLTMVLLGPY